MALRMRKSAQDKQAQLRSWGVILIRRKGEFLGYIQAADLKAPRPLRCGRSV
jgi:hypothetical protein